MLLQKSFQHEMKYKHNIINFKEQKINQRVKNKRSPKKKRIDKIKSYRYKKLSSF